jgi:plastocyanin
VTLRRILPTAAACLALLPAGALIAGCGSDDDDSGGGGAAASTPADTATGGGVAVKIKDIKFDPKTVTVKVGQTITWTNEDAVAHNVTAEEGADFKSDNLNKGDTFEFTPEAAGTIAYVCTIHPGQDGSITVTS